MDTGSDLHRHRGSGTEGAMAVDPVCGMAVDPQTAKHKATHKGRPYFFCCSGCKAKFEADPGRYLKKDDKSAPCSCLAREVEEDAVTDPVCGMTVSPHTAKYRADYGGRPTYFCSAGCKVKFQTNPKRYLEPDAFASPPVPEGAIYTCPMHPEIRQVGPGSCPICGMALDPELPSATEEPNPELAEMSRRFWIGLALTLPVFVMEMGGHLFGLGHEIDPQTLNWVQLALATPVVLWCGWPFFERGWQSLKTRSLNMFTLIAMGTGVAWIYSVIATLLPDMFPASISQRARARSRSISKPPRSLRCSCCLGKFWNSRRSRNQWRDPSFARSWRRKQARRIDADGPSATCRSKRLQAGDRLRVRPGENVPVDGGSSKAAARSTSRWSRASRCRLTRMPATRSPAAPSTTGRLRHARRRGRQRDDAGANRPHGQRSATQPRADPTAGRPRGRLVCPAGDCGRR